MTCVAPQLQAGPPPTFYSLTEAAAELHCSKGALAKRIQKAQIPWHLEGTHTHYINSDALPQLRAMARPTKALVELTHREERILLEGRVPNKVVLVLAALDAVAHVMHVKPAAILAHTRVEPVPAARQALMKILHMAGMSKSDIGRALGRDHSTICFGIPKAEKRIWEPALADLCTQALKGDSSLHLPGQLFSHSLISMESLARRLPDWMPVLAITAYLRSEILAVRKADMRLIYHGLWALTCYPSAWTVVARMFILAGQQGQIHRMMQHAQDMGLTWKHDPHAVLRVA